VSSAEASLLTSLLERASLGASLSGELEGSLAELVDSTAEDSGAEELA